jgi:pyrroloquinoline-quinone synthase/pyrroloquinoline quinone biosynthesis protein D
MNEDSIPNFAADVVLRFDEAAERWLMVGEERTLALDASAFSFVQLIDGSRSVAEIATLVADKRVR